MARSCSWETDRTGGTTSHRALDGSPARRASRPALLEATEEPPHRAAPRAGLLLAPTVLRVSVHSRPSHGPVPTWVKLPSPGLPPSRPSRPQCQSQSQSQSQQHLSLPPSRPSVASHRIAVPCPRPSPAAAPAHGVASSAPNRVPVASPCPHVLRSATLG